MKKDAVKAFQDAAPYHAELREIHKWFMPFRTPTAERSQQGQSTAGSSRTAHLFDSTALSAAFTFAGNMQADWMPPHGEFFTVKAGPLAPEDSRDEITRVMQGLARRAHAVLPTVHNSVHEMFIDLFAGTGALLVNPGNARYPVLGRAVPVLEMAMEEGPYGPIWRRWWKRNWRADDIPEIWPHGRISDKLARVIAMEPSTPIEVTQATIYDPKLDRWCLCVWSTLDDDKSWIWWEEFYSSPWITPRFFKVPGESFGRGLAHLGLPGTKTTNKARELALHAAAFAVMGLWIRRDDGVFNPDTAVFAPGKMWDVASTGGAFGPSIARLDVPRDFDISTVVMQDERDQLRKILLDDELPDQQDPVRSATEIAGRLRRYARMKGGAGSRLSHELVTALVERVIDILVAGNMAGGLPQGFRIDQMLTQIVITAPAAAAQRSADVERLVNWVQIIAMLWGPQAAFLMTKVKDLAPQLGRWMGVEEEHIPSKAELKDLEAVLAQAIAQQQAAAQKPPTSEEQTRALVSGQGAQGAPGQPMGAMQ